MLSAECRAALLPLLGGDPGEQGAQSHLPTQVRARTFAEALIMSSQLTSSCPPLHFHIDVGFRVTICNDEVLCLPLSDLAATGYTCCRALEMWLE